MFLREDEHCACYLTLMKSITQVVFEHFRLSVAVLDFFFFFQKDKIPYSKSRHV